LTEETSVERGDAIVVAISGGGDSVALLHVLSLLAARRGLKLHAHGVDHGLRPDADAELKLAEQHAQALGVSFSRCSVDLPPGGNLQARARDARYAALDAVADAHNARWVATAHHADDRAETVMMRILRGSSAAGLRVLPACSPRRLRPLIRSTREAVLLHLKRHALQWAEDPSNRDRRFLRTRIRHELMPLLTELSPAVREHLSALADEPADATEPVTVTDAQGRSVALGRRHITQIRRAQNSGRSGARIWLPGGLEMQVDASGSAVLDTGIGAPRKGPEKSGAAGKKPRPALQKPEAGGAKASKSD
jgi:tRNA(Ile)-lysidine synthase